MRTKKQPEPVTYESVLALMQKNARESEKLGKWIKEMQKEIGGISKSNGEVAESYFVNSFTNNMQFAGQKYDSLTPNLKKKDRKLNLQGEYDFVMYNCSSVVILEIKYKARKEDVQKLLLKAPIFKQLFPQYAHYGLYLGLAAFHFDTSTEENSIEQGIAVIKRVGKNVVINDEHLKLF